MIERRCSCGCEGSAVYRVKSEDLDGTRFTEYCCRSAFAYLSECATEAEKPFEWDYILTLDDNED